MASPLTLSAKLTRLFEFFHARTEPQMAVEAVAIFAGQRLGRVIDPASLTEARDSDGGLALDVRDVLCELFGVDPVYLSLGAQHDAVTERRIERIDRNLHLWTLARDRGLKHLATRCGSPEAVDLLIRELERMPVLAAPSIRPHHRMDFPAEQVHRDLRLIKAI